jgi:hypothetical protein
VGLAPGCAKESEPSTTPSEETPDGAEPSAETTQVLLYFNRGEYLGVAGRVMDVEKEPANRVKVAMEALLEGPSANEIEWGLTGSCIPTGTIVNDVSLDGDVATVDLSKQFESGGGSLSMLLRVAQVVYTATQIDGVNTVAFKLDGVPVEAIGGEGVIVSPPVSRADFEGQAPAILVESPVPGQEVTSTITLAGSANVFEAQFTVEVEDSTGAVVSTTPVFATSGTGTRGTFDTKAFSYGPWTPGRYTVVFFEPSPKDGSRTNVVEIPIEAVE